MECVGRVTRRVRHHLAESVVLLLRRLRRDSRPGDIYNDFLERVLWWGQLVTSPLWAQQLSFEHLLEIAKTHRQTTSELSTKRVSRFCLPIAVVLFPIVQPALWHTFIPFTVYRPYSPCSEPGEANSGIRCTLIAGAWMMDDG